MSEAEVKKMMDELAVNDNSADDQASGQSTHHEEEAHQDMLCVQGDSVVGEAELAADDPQANTHHTGFTAEGFQEFE